MPSHARVSSNPSFVVSVFSAHSVVRYVLSSSRAPYRWEMRTEMTAPFLPQVYYWRVPSTHDGESARA